MVSFEELDLPPELLVAAKAAHNCTRAIHKLGMWISLTATAIQRTRNAPPDTLDDHCNQGSSHVAELAASAANLREGLKPVYKSLVAAIPGKKKVGPHPAISVHHGILDLAKTMLDSVLWHANTRSPDFQIDEETKAAVKESWRSAAEALAKEEYIRDLQDTIDEALPLIANEAALAEPLFRRDTEEVERKQREAEEANARRKTEAKAAKSRKEEEAKLAAERDRLAEIQRKQQAKADRLAAEKRRLDRKQEEAKLAAERDRLAEIQRQQQAEADRLAAEKGRLGVEAEAQIETTGVIPAEFRDQGQENGHPLTAAYLSSNPDWRIPGCSLTRAFANDPESRLRLGRAYAYRYDKALQLRDRIARSNRENAKH